MRGDSADTLFESFLQGAIVSRSGMDSFVHSLMLSIQHLLCQPLCLDGFREPVMARDTPEPCRFLSLDSYHPQVHWLGRGHHYK